MDNMEDVTYIYVDGICAYIYIGIVVARLLFNTDRGLKAIQLFKECLTLLYNTDLKKQEQLVKHFKIVSCGMIFKAYLLIKDYTNAVKYCRELFVICNENGETAEESNLAIALATICNQHCRHAEALELYKRGISLLSETGDREGERTAYRNIAITARCLRQRVQVKEYYEKALAISIEIGDKKGEAKDSRKLGGVFISLGENGKAKEYYKKSLAISIEIGDRKGEASSYGKLGTVVARLGEYAQAQEYLEKALSISIEIGDRKKEAFSSGNLGTVISRLGKGAQAKEHLKKAIAIRMEISDRVGLAKDYGNLSTVFKSLSEYDKAEEYLKKALEIKIEIGDREEEAAFYGDLGVLFNIHGKHVQAKEYLDKALAIQIEIGARKGEALSHGNLGTLYLDLGEHAQAKEHLEKALSIHMEIDDRKGVAFSYDNLGATFNYLGKSVQAKEYYEKALTIKMEIGDRAGQASSYGNLGAITGRLGEYAQAQQYFEKALAISTEIGDRQNEAFSYGHLGALLLSADKHVMAEGYLEKALSIYEDIGISAKGFMFCCALMAVKVAQQKIQEANHYVRIAINKSEDLRSFLVSNDQFNIAFSDVHDDSYQALIVFFCLFEDPNNALYVLELERARALADLMAAQYSVERQIKANPQSWIGIENIMKKESNCTCLYISHFAQDAFLWILTTNGIIHFRRKEVDESDAQAGLPRDLKDFFTKSFRSFRTLPDENCKDRSLNNVEPYPKSPQEESPENVPLVEDDDEDYQDPDILCYKVLIAPMADLMGEPEIIIVPDSSLYHVPFVAVRDEDGKYLSETFRIRIILSLTTLKLIQDSPADYHSQTGALVVGDPVVGQVLYKGSVADIKPLPCARNEAEMIGRLLGVQPLLGQHATKQAVLQRIHSVSLIHFAAHGNAERGEIALSPVRSTNRIPEEEEYLLTMSDISQVQLRAKLVVLSCCHSARGHIRAEGVIGIAREFLGSGARSVLVALWALEDSATEQLMHCFYEHLVREESVSECLHEAMKWMRCNGYSDVRQWAPFMLIGDNVKFDIEKIKDERP